MTTARMHDGAPLEVSVRGAGPAVLIPVSTARMDPESAERLRAWGADPELGHRLATGLAGAGFRVITAGYEDHLSAHPKPDTLTPDAVAADLLAVADAAGTDRFGYYGYSWLALAGLQLAIRTDRLTALAMGGYPPLGGPYAAMLGVTRTAHRMALAARDRPPAPPAEPEPGDWDSAEIARTPEQTAQYVTLYEALQGFDERAALDRLRIPRLAFAGARDVIEYGPKWGNARVDIAGPLQRHRDELTGRAWTVHMIPDTDHMATMHARRVLAILVPWLTANLTRPAGTRA